MQAEWVSQLLCGSRGEGERSVGWRLEAGGEVALWPSPQESLLFRVKPGCWLLPPRTPLDNEHWQNLFSIPASASIQKEGPSLFLPKYGNQLLPRINFFLSLWECWVSVAAHELSLVAGSGGCSCAWPSQCRSFCRCREVQALERGLSGVVHGLRYFTAHGIFSHQGLNQCPLHW